MLLTAQSIFLGWVLRKLRCCSVNLKGYEYASVCHISLSAAMPHLEASATLWHWLQSLQTKHQKYTQNCFILPSCEFHPLSKVTLPIYISGFTLKIPKTTFDRLTAWEGTLFPIWHMYRILRLYSLHDFRHWLQCKLDLHSSRMLCSTDWYLVTDIAGQPSSPIFKGQIFEGGTDRLCRNDGNTYSQRCITSQNSKDRSLFLTAKNFKHS
jgi:hypothetical protein